MSEKKRKRASMARVEYRAIQTEVEKKLADGFSLRIVYEDFTGAGRLAIGYSTFCDYVRGKGERLHGKPKKPTPVEAPKPASRPTPPATGRAEKSTSFVHERNVPLDELV